MYTRAQHLTSLDDIVQAMRQNIALMQGDTEKAKRYLRGDNGYQSLLTRESPKGIEKYSAWAQSFVELMMRLDKPSTPADQQFTAENIAKLNLKPNDLTEIAVALDLILKTEKSTFLNYNQKYADDPDEKFRYLANIQKQLANYLPKDPVELEQKQREFLKKSGVNITPDGNSLSESIIIQRREARNPTPTPTPTPAPVVETKTSNDPVLPRKEIRSGSFDDLDKQVEREHQQAERVRSETKAREIEKNRYSTIEQKAKQTSSPVKSKLSSIKQKIVNKIETITNKPKPHR